VTPKQKVALFIEHWLYMERTHGPRLTQAQNQRLREMWAEVTRARSSSKKSEGLPGVEETS